MDLLNPPVELTDDTSTLPAHFMAADNHNLPKGDFAFTDPSTWGQGVENAGKFAVAAAYSGLNSFYNTGVAIGNAFGAEAEYNDTARGLADIDSDLGQYYLQHQTSVDTVGFLAGSFIPGTMGVKMLNVGQKVLSAGAKTGILGENIAQAVGLLPSAAEKYAMKAGTEMAAAQASFNTLNGNVLKSLAAGYGQNVLEGAAFQTVVLASMYKSPVLDGADTGALVSDLITSSFEFGAIGAAFGAAKNYGIIKRTITAGDKQEKAFTQLTELPKSLSVSDRIIAASEDLTNTPAVKDVLLEGQDVSMANKLNRLKGQREISLNNDIRTGIRGLAKGDDEFGNAVADTVKGLDSSLMQGMFLGAEQIGRIGTKMDTEVALAKSAEKYPGVQGATPAKAVQYIKLIGEDAGDVVTDVPGVVNIADTVKNSDQVRAKIASYGFKESKQWSAIEGAQGVDHLESEARYWWAQNVAKVKNGMTVGEHDIPMLERIYTDWAAQTKTGSADALTNIKISSPDAGIYSVTNAEDLMRGLRQSKHETITYLMRSKAAGNSDLSIDSIGKVANVSRSYIKGDTALNEADDLFAHQRFQDKYNAQLAAKGLRGNVDTTMVPSWMKVAMDYSPVADKDGMVTGGLSYLMAKGKLAQQAVDNVFAKAVGDDFLNRFLSLDMNDVQQANRYGAGPRMFKSANGQYGSLASKTESIGAATASLKQQWRKDTNDALETTLTALGSNQEAAIEREALKNKIHSTGEKYVLSDDGSALVNRTYKEYQDAVKAGAKNLSPPSIQEGAPLRIPIVNQEVRDSIATEINLNAGRITTEREMRAAQGLETNKDGATWYPERPNPRDYKYFAVVVDPTVTGGSYGQKSMIHAATPEQLEQMIDKVPSRFQVLTKKNSEEFHRALGDFDTNLTLNENYIDTALKSAGVNNQFFSQTDPQKIINGILDSHMQNSDIIARELVNAKYQPQFDALKSMGSQYTGVSLSQYSGGYKYAENAVHNPYTSYIKTALDVKQTAEYTKWQSLNEALDTAYSKMHKTVSDTFFNSKSPEDLDKINDMLTKYGAKSAYQDTASILLANHSVPRGELTKFVSRANSILSTLTLGIDPLNAVNNAVGANVLLGAEVNNVLKRIGQGDVGSVGALAALKDIAVPGTDSAISSGAKIIGKSYQRFFSAEGRTLDDFYVKNGWMPKDVTEMRRVTDALTLEGTESVGALQGKISEAMNAARKFSDWGYQKSGNLWAERMNRWVAADVMKQISDIAVAGGKMSPQEQISYINSFVNRTQGNFLASQRPIAFQGPIGNAIGLFQTYQFNLLQQMFRYAAEGSAKDTAMLMGLQSTLYGMNGLPAFNFINTHIVGTMSSNPSHQDAYTTIYGAAGKNIGNWITYGAASNLLQTNLYSRGDINPRQVTIIPTNPADIPFVNATATFFGNIQNTVKKLNDGGNAWQTILQGIEHNGLSRPLAGIAQVAQFTSVGKPTATSKQGTILGQNDLLSLATISRLAGGRPLDEAVANDAMYRVNAYKAVDTQRKKDLAEAVKTSVIGGLTPEAEQYAEFSAKYAATGGDTKRFNQYMMKQVTSANTPEAEKIVQQLKSPYAQRMQEIMGGTDLLDQ